MRFLSFFTQITRIMYLVAFISFLMRISQFMSLPFLAIYLSHQGVMTASQIGLVLGIGPLVFSATGLMNGMYVDRQSHKRTIIFGFAFSIGFFYGLLLLNAALGWLRSLVDISAIAMVVDHTPSEKLSLGFSARFIGVNLGVAIGPLLGAYMATTQYPLSIFFISGGIYFVIALGMIFYREKPKIKISSSMQDDLLTHFFDVVKNKFLIIITLINFIIWVIYAQMDTTFPQFLAQHVKNPATLFSYFMLINALICVFFQPIILRWAELTSPKLSGIAGCVMFSISFLMLSFYPSIPFMIIAIAIMSFGELFILPVNALLVMKAAPKNLLSSYNGFTNFSLLGLSFGPILGGLGLQFIGSSYLFFLDGLLPIIAIWLYLKFIRE